MYCLDRMSRISCQENEYVAVQLRNCPVIAYMIYTKWLYSELQSHFAFIHQIKVLRNNVQLYQEEQLQQFFLFQAS